MSFRSGDSAILEAVPLNICSVSRAGSRAQTGLETRSQGSAVGCPPTPRPPDLQFQEEARVGGAGPRCTVGGWTPAFNSLPSSPEAREKLGVEPGSQLCGHRVLKIQRPFFVFLGLPKKRGTERHSVARKEAAPLGCVEAWGLGRESLPSSRPSMRAC